MAETTIQWTATPRPDGTFAPGYTFNPWIGCTKVHAGCQACYAEADMDHRRHRVKWGPNGTRSRTSDDYWKQPLKWNRAAEKAGERRRVFCASLADVFEDWDGAILNHNGEILFRSTDDGSYRGQNTPAVEMNLSPHEQATMNDMRRDLFAIIDSTPWLDWQLLTKRPKNVRRMWPQLGFPDAGVPGTLGRRPRLSNVWIGTSISNQQTADVMLPELLKLRDLTPCLFVSAEPLLGPIVLADILKLFPIDPPMLWGKDTQGQSSISWIIIGGESGPHARPCDVAWIRSLVQQCQAAGVPCFVKQMGERLAVANDSASEWPRHGDEWETVPADYMPRFQGERVTLRMAHKGGEIADWPHDLRVRQFPEVQR